MKPAKNINFLKYQYLHYFISGAMVLFILATLFAKGLNLGIDFSGGTVLEVEFTEEVSIEDLRDKLTDSFHEVDIQNYENNPNIFLFKINLGDLEVENSATYVKGVLAKNLNYGFNIRRLDSIGPKVSGDTLSNGLIALTLAVLAITAYIWARFNLSFSFCAVFGLIHDALIAFGFYVVLNVEFNLTSIAAILTIIGYSINNSVVVFDRIRENLRKFKKMETRDLINLSIHQTLSRTIITSLTTILACMVLAIFTSGAISDFSSATIIGIVAGTYSTIFIVTNLLTNFQLRNIQTK